MTTSHSNLNVLHRRIQACRLAQRSSDDFIEAFGRSKLDSIAPFERDEIILGRRVGSGSFSSVYEIHGFNLRSDQSEIYCEEQVKEREATVKSVKNGKRYVMKCLKDKLEVSDDENVFLGAAQDIVHEAEMLAALSHPNIVKLQGVVARRQLAFLEGGSQFFIIMERLECTLAEKIEVWSKEKNAFSPSKSFKTLSSTRLGSSRALSTNRVDASSTAAGRRTSLRCRIQVASSLAGVMEYLHSKGIIFRDLKSHNVGFDRRNSLKLFDFGLARFISPDSDAYEDLHHLGGSGTPRYSAPEVFFLQPYNLKADVYSFSVLLWEVMSLKKPFAKYNQKEDFRKAFLKLDFETLAINRRRWPQSIQYILERGLSRDLWKRPTFSEVCSVLDDCALFIDDNENVRTRSFSLARSKRILVDLSRRQSERDLQKSRYSFGPVNRDTSNREICKRHLSETSRTMALTFEDFLLQEGEMWDRSLHSTDAGTFQDYSQQEKEKSELWKLNRHRQQY